ncbi:MAG: PAS domain S-box protein [Thermodesulfobacteriota bacterium]
MNEPIAICDSETNPIPYRQILSMISQGIAVLSEGIVVYANAALCDIAGKNRGEMIGHMFLDLVADMDRSRIALYLQNLHETTGEDIIFRVHRSKTAGRDVMMKALPVHLQGVYCHNRGICCCVTDITLHLDHFQALQRENRRMRSLLDDTESVLLSLAPHDCEDILSVNRHVEAMIGCSVKDLKNGRRHWFDFVHPDFLNQVTAFYKKFPDTFENETLEYVVIGNDKSPRWVRDTGNVLFVERGHGMPRRVDHTIVDITEQKQREVELEAERTKLASIIRNSTDMIYRVDYEGNFLDLNPAGIQLLGLEEGFRTRKILDFYVDPKQRDRLLKNCETTAGCAQQVAKWRLGDGKQIDVVINVVAEKDMTGRIVSFHGIVHNVTQTLEMQKLESVKKMAGGLSDHINTPLMIISVNISQMREILDAATIDKEELITCLDEMKIAFSKIVEPLKAVRDTYWKIEEVPDGVGGTIYEIHDGREAKRKGLPGYAE